MSNLKILIVDDEENMLEMLKKFFLINDYECKTATNGLEALDILK